jgi:DNA repair protein RadD
MQLRPYQQLALDTLWAYLRTKDGNPALVLPTGAGKSPLMAAIASEAVTAWGGRVGVIAHVQELVAQNAAKLAQYAPTLPMGIYSAGLNRRDRFDPVLFLQIQSVYNRASVFGPFDLLLIDEAHRIPLDGEGRYLQFIADCRALNPNLRVVGLTATPYRLKGQAVPVCGPGRVLTEVAYEARIPDLIAAGFLSRLVSRAGERPDLSRVAIKRGEYDEAQLAAAMDDAGLIERTCDDLCNRAADRKAWIVFCVNVAHAEHVRAALAARGIAAGLVHGGTPKGERAALLAEFQAGHLRAMVNVNVLSEGFDAPGIDCVAMLRPTKSPGLYYQQVGRGFRLAPGKKDCLVLDYAGNVLEHGPVDAIRVRTARPGKAAGVMTARAKECPCGALLAFGVRTCPECGHNFGGSDPAHLDRPIDAPVLSTDRDRIVATHTVQSVKYERHAKPGKIPSLRVTYQCGLRRFSEWVCLEHSGMAHAKALRWWMARGGAAGVPRTVEEALPLAWALPTPARITVDETDKYPAVVAHEFAERTEEPDEPAAVNLDRAPSWLRQALQAAA